MTGEQMVNQLQGKQAAQLRACFPDLPEHGLLQILGSATPKQAVHVLQQCFGCDLADAKAAWNEYVLRYVDGAERDGRADGAGRYVL